MKKRPSKDEYYIDIAREVSRRSTCLRRRYGAVIVSESDKIISTGYNGAIRKAIDCLEIGKCMRKELNINHGERYELCKAFHAEQNAILSANPMERKGATLYLYGENSNGKVEDANPCMMCRRMIVQGELKLVKALQADGSIKVLDVKDFVYAEDKGDNFPEEIIKTKEFKRYIKYFKKLNL
ncbi:cytidine deaminase [Candidatus Woesearchaeota archaeon]|nr:cytidine deaminase [Candidatus Woesearchaeota archaeon]